MVFVVEFKYTLQMNTKRECLQDRQLQWFSYLQRAEEGFWHSKHGKMRLVVFI